MNRSGFQGRSGSDRTAHAQGLHGFGAYLLASSLTLAACSHTRTVGDAPRTEADAKNVTQDHADQAPKNQGQKTDEGGRGGGSNEMGRKSGTSETPSYLTPYAAEGGATRAPAQSAAEAGGPPLSTSPAGLLKPEAATSIQKKLVAAGYLAEKNRSDDFDQRTREALRQFQSDRKLPATGMPDDETMRALGLETSDVFVSTSKKEPAGRSKGDPTDSARKPDRAATGDTKAQK